MIVFDLLMKIRLIFISAAMYGVNVSVFLVVVLLVELVGLVELVDLVELVILVE